MDIRTRHYNDVAILSPSGRLDTAAAAQFSQTIAAQMAAGYHRLVVDLQQVDFLNSAAIKAMIIGAQRARRQGGDFRLADARSQVKYVLHLAGVDAVIKLFPDVVGATASYFPGPLTGE